MGEKSRTSPLAVNMILKQHKIGFCPRFNLKAYLLVYTKSNCHVRIGTRFQVAFFCSAVVVVPKSLTFMWKIIHTQLKGRRFDFCFACMLQLLTTYDLGMKVPYHKSHGQKSPCLKDPSNSRLAGGIHFTTILDYS